MHNAFDSVQDGDIGNSVWSDISIDWYEWDFFLTSNRKAAHVHVDLSIALLVYTVPLW